MTQKPEYDDVFPNGEGDGPCGMCGATVQGDQQARHVTWHQEVWQGIHSGA